MKIFQILAIVLVFLAVAIAPTFGAQVASNHGLEELGLQLKDDASISEVNLAELITDQGSEDLQDLLKKQDNDGSIISIVEKIEKNVKCSDDEMLALYYKEDCRSLYGK